MQIESENFAVNYEYATETDATKTIEIAENVREQVQELYPHNFHEGYDGPRIHIYSAAEEMREEIGQVNANSNCGPSSGDIHIQAPSWTDHFGTYGELSEPFKALLTHEYTHLPFYYDLYGKDRGFKEQPPWFHQGIAEYIADVFPPSRKEKIKRSLQMGKFDACQNPYAWGPFIFRYIYESYSIEQIQSLIKSSEPSFPEAVVKELNVSYHTFTNRWQEAVADQFGFEWSTQMK